MTQARLAEDSGISVEHLSKIERCLSSPSFMVIQRLSASLGEPPHRLFRKDLQGPYPQQPPRARECSRRLPLALAVLACLAETQASKAKGGEARDICLEIAAHIRHAAMLLDLLSVSGPDDSLDLGDYLRTILSRLVRLHPDTSAALRIRTDALRLPARKALPLGLATCELLTGVYRHANGASSVRIRVEDLGRDGVRMTLSDELPDLPQRLAGADDGRALALVRALVEIQMGGVFAMHDNGGAVATLSFQLQDDKFSLP